MARSADGSGTVVPREWHDQLTGASVPTKHSLAPVGLFFQERESMTLFYLASNNELFKKVIDKYYNSKMDENTIKLLEIQK